jgi:hypothetical protein
LETWPRKDERATAAILVHRHVEKVGVVTQIGVYWNPKHAYGLFLSNLSSIDYDNRSFLGMRRALSWGVAASSLSVLLPALKPLDTPPHPTVA